MAATGLTVRAHKNPRPRGTQRGAAVRTWCWRGEHRTVRGRVGV